MGTNQMQLFVVNFLENDYTCTSMTRQTFGIGVN